MDEVKVKLLVDGYREGNRFYNGDCSRIVDQKMQKTEEKKKKYERWFDEV
jgi:hypothetical protein